MPRPRRPLTVRRVTIATVIVSFIVLTGLEVRRRRAVFHILAVRYGSLEESPFPRFGSMTYEQYQSTQRRWPRLKPYYAMMKEKYRYAERHPWLPVAADPPEPE
jgi:hypothetical protein